MSVPATHDDIARLAYDLWIERGRPLGSPELDWERAERLLEFSDPRPSAAATQNSRADFLQADPPVTVTGTSSRSLKGATRVRIRKSLATPGKEVAP